MSLGLVPVLAAGAVLGTLYLMWPRNDVPHDPDVVVVLGGAGGERTELGIELAERYDADLVLSSSAAVFGREQGRRCGHDAICFDPAPETTRGEARNVAALAEDHGWRRVTVATSDFHTTRSRLLFRQCLGEATTVVGARDSTRAGMLAELPKETLGSVAGLTIQRAC